MFADFETKIKEKLLSLHSHLRSVMRHAYVKYTHFWRGHASLLLDVDEDSKPGAATNPTVIDMQASRQAGMTCGLCSVVGVCVCCELTK
jgi:hypothetical protein